MSVTSKRILSEAAQVDAAAVQNFPCSRKIHVTGSRDDIRVPMREIAQADTVSQDGRLKNPALTVYDTSGPYTDPEASIDIRRGLPPLRAGWIAERNDTAELAGLTSVYGLRREQDRALDQLRFMRRSNPRKATGGAVTQLHYARAGIVTPEMEYIAIRENQRLEQAVADGLTADRMHPGESFGAGISVIVV